MRETGVLEYWSIGARNSGERGSKKLALVSR